ncbi:DUF7507 domain-containing protein [Flavobacterium aquicola]|uniref:Uncharacterized protein n=1 Tax=Flavobacterium aquicola TaxID=1682742 RepID=A0A3E0E0M1_9FLAO|nr:hypothetical protein [Flavobacterium aquicola]REG91200.1 hypothetical protein C8P67_11796 [Flavobacterium aquicola]
MIKKILSLFCSASLPILATFFLSTSSKVTAQAGVTRIHTDWKGYWTANGATTGTNRPDLENNLIGFEWNGTTYSTGVDDVTLISKVPSASIQKFRALKIQSLSYTGSTYFLQGAAIDNPTVSSVRILTPPLGAGTSTPAELASRLTDGINGLALGTGIANIATNSVFFKVGTGNLNLLGLNDNIPDLIVTQVAEPGGGTPDVFRFVDATGALVGNAISINFGAVNKVGSYSLDLFNASNGAIAGSFTAQETRDIRILGYDTSAFGITAANAPQVDRFEVVFSGYSDCAFIAFNANSLKKAELSLVKTASVSGCGIAGDVINYTFVVTNTGDVSVTNVVVTDPMTGLVISGTQGSTLAVGATVTLTGTYTITASDVTAGKVTNQAKVTGLDPSLNIVEDLSGQTNGNNVATVTNLLSPPTGITGTAAICKGDSTVLTVSGGALTGTGASIEWFAGTCGGTPIGTGTSITVSPASNTTYYVRYKNNCTSTACFSRLVTVNPTPTLTAASQPVFTCAGSPAAINLTGLLAGSTSTISYTINGGSTLTATGVSANLLGVGNFATGNLTVAENGKILKITGITVTSGTPNCSTVFSQDVTLIVNSDSGPISLNNVAYLSNGSAAYCASNIAVFSIAPVSGASGYTWVVPAGWKTESGVVITAPVSTVLPELKVITGTSAQSGSVSVMASNLFCPSSLTVTLSTIPPSAPAFSKTDAVCAVPTGTITISSPAPAAGTVYTVTGTVPAVPSVTNTTGVFSGLAAGTYVATYQIGSGCVSASTATITIAPLVTNTWNGTAWSAGSAPTSSQLVVFEGDYTISGSIHACSCTVKPNVNVTIASGTVLTVENGLHVETGAVPALDGTLTFENGASLIQNNDAKNGNTGSIIYKRTATSIKDFDYVYWSSPVAGQTLGALSPQSDKYWSWFGNYWKTAVGGDTMIEGLGYIARVPRYVTSQTVNFIGTPNNGDVTIAAQGALMSNLIGNPYPSAIDAEEFMVENEDLLVTGGMLAFWTHTTRRKLSGDKTQYEYLSDDYSFYNVTGGTATDPKNIGSKSGGPAPDGTIAAGQSFMLGSKTAGSFKFTNSMRIVDPGQNNHFFKQTNTKKTAKKEKNRIWLNLTNSGGAFKQLLIGYITGATNGEDKLFDGTSRNSNAFVDFYSIMNEDKYTIQGRGLPFDEQDEVPLGYKTTIEGTFQIDIEKTDGFLTSQTVYLEDKMTNVIHDLTKGSYSFTTAKGDFKDRFVLRYTNTSKLGTGDFVAKGKGVIVSVKNSQIKINSFDSSLSSVKVYDLKGSLLYEKDKVSGNEFIINHLNSSNQFMIVMVQLENGKWISEEIIYHD